MRLTAIVKPTHECNLSCTYCYVREDAEEGRMNNKTLENVFIQLTKNSKDKYIHIIWHGGEPLLMGLDFYKKIVDLCKRFKKKGYHISNGIQSNGILVTDELLDFVEKENDFRLGLSLDGPKEVNDKTRVYKDGRGAFDDIIKGIRKVNKRSENGKVRMLNLGGGVITVLHKKNINKIDKIYDFFRQEKINIKINPLINPGTAKGNVKDLEISPREYAKAMIELFDMWINEYNSIDIDPFTMIMGNLMTGIPIGCNYSISCRQNFISIGPKGDIYPCGRFDGEKNFWMGNINERDGLEKALSSKIQRKLSKRNLETIPGCNICDYSNVCNGGCMHNALMTGNVLGEDNYCVAYKKIFNHIENFLHSELNKAEVKNA